MSALLGDVISEVDEDDDEKNPAPIRLPKVSGEILEKVIAFCSHHQTEPMTPITTPLRSDVLQEVVQEWYADFVTVPKEMLFGLVAAANYLNITQLLDLTCLAVSILIKGKSAQELREMFNIPAELSEEERAGINPATENNNDSTPVS